MNAPADWFETFFSGLAIEFWRCAVPASATLEETAFLWKHLALFPGARVLDVACGHGRLAVPLAAKGCAVTGVDISGDFLRAAERTAAEAGVSMSVAWKRADMRNLPWSGAFDAAYCMGNSFGFCDDAGNRESLASAASALAAGGRFVLDFGQAAESIFPRLEAHLEADIGDFHFEEETRYDVSSARIENRFVISRGAEREEKLASQAVYLVSEVERMLEAAGFEPRARFGSSAEEPYALGAHRLLIVAKKRA